MSLNAREALQVVLAQSFRKTRETVAMDANALGRVLASGIRAPQPSPRWDVSAMDGYALRSADFPQAYGKPLLVAGSQFAGQRALTLRKGQALAVMTGALIPTGADAVLPKERARVADNKLYVETSADVQKGDHIRCAGEELKRGAAVAKSGTRLSSRWIGFLSGLGIAKVQVWSKPKAALLVTGSELASLGRHLRPGMIYDSNGPMLEAALAEEGITARARRVKDEPAILKKELSLALLSSDLLLISGGVSVGDADHSRRLLGELGVQTLFWGVAQKPGKPLFFGRKGRTLVFGLPGNPAAAWICFHQYVKPLLSGVTPSQTLRADKTPKADPKKTLFLKARRVGSVVELLGGQQSHMLGALAEADALARVEPGSRSRSLELQSL